MTDTDEIKFAIRYLKNGLHSKRTPPLYELLMKELGFVKKDKVQELEKENAELKAQIEIMKSCVNCRYCINEEICPWQPKGCGFKHWELKLRR